MKIKGHIKKGLRRQETSGTTKKTVKWKHQDQYGGYRMTAPVEDILPFVFQENVTMHTVFLHTLSAELKTALGRVL